MHVILGHPNIWSRCMQDNMRLEGQGILIGVMDKKKRQVKNIAFGRVFYVINFNLVIVVVVLNFWRCVYIVKRMCKWTGDGVV